VDGAALSTAGFEGLDGLESAAADWDALLAAGDADPLCNSHAWTLAHARAFSSDTEIFGWRVFDGDALIGIGAFRLEPRGERRGLRRAQLVADGSFDSDYLEFPALRGRGPDVGAALARALCAAELPGARLARAVVLGPMRANSPGLAGFLAFAGERRLPHREHEVPASAADLGDDFEGTLAGLKKRMRSKVRQALRRAAADGWRLTWCEHASELRERQATLYDLHTRRWQARGEPGSYTDGRRRAFYDLLLPRALDAGWLRFAQLEDGAGRALASQLGFRLGDTYYQLQEGYDPELEDRRPGLTLRALALEALIGEGVRRYDYLGGAAAGKADWGAIEERLVVVGCALPGLRARLAYGARAFVYRWRA
jgi:CelD/BcsL family acetyltransferase involved in cellulose biosynthesis